MTNDEKMSTVVRELAEYVRKHKCGKVVDDMKSVLLSTCFGQSVPLNIVAMYRRLDNRNTKRINEVIALGKACAHWPSDVLDYEEMNSWRESLGLLKPPRN